MPCVNDVNGRNAAGMSARATGVIGADAVISDAAGNGEAATPDRSRRSETGRPGADRPAAFVAVVGLSLRRRG